ncbi:hypothetical protein Taro_013218 [Colocasia esculenta]|uniref:Peptidase A1 domain-containing protein n=1 Tax=Colocasia esculenta TaxID=4460 RepID=A0A843UFT3_COLES|nr:hypothetical protein [Colocasia esculenta]
MLRLFPATRLGLPLFSSILASLFLVLCLPPAACDGLGTKFLVLERAVPVRGAVELEALKARDRARHGRLLGGVVDFPVDGSSSPFSVGLYFTRVRLGNPPKEFYVQIDTGSDILWVTCNPCNGCPTSSGLNIPLEFFDPGMSSTSSLITCADQRCSYAFQTSDAFCVASATQSNLCGYRFQYGDGSGTLGYYVSDTMYFDTIIATDQTVNTSASVIFGCSNSQSGDLTKPDRAVDGIFGFGQHEFSVISQLSSLGMAPKVFSHCLKGSNGGGGILVIGEIVEPGIVYTPLVQSQPHYNLNLQGIAVNGQVLPIDSSVFATSTTQGTIVDSGTTLVYLAEQAYDPFVNAVSIFLFSAPYNVVKGNQCFVAPGSVDEIFPSVTLYFEDNAAMVLQPRDYLLQEGSENSIMWCIGWQKIQGQGMTILGGGMLHGYSLSLKNFFFADLVLKDKIVVYDLARQRIGWTNYDCSLPVNVTTSSGKNDVVNAGQLRMSGSPHDAIYRWMTMGFLVFLVHSFLFFFFCFL